MPGPSPTPLRVLSSQLPRKHSLAPHADSRQREGQGPRARRRSNGSVWVVGTPCAGSESSRDRRHRDQQCDAQGGPPPFSRRVRTAARQGGRSPPPFGPAVPSCCAQRGGTLPPAGAADAPRLRHGLPDDDHLPALLLEADRSRLHLPSPRDKVSHNDGSGSPATRTGRTAACERDGCGERRRMPAAAGWRRQPPAWHVQSGPGAWCRLTLARPQWVGRGSERFHGQDHCGTGTLSGRQ